MRGNRARAAVLPCLTPTRTEPLPNTVRTFSSGEQLAVAGSMALLVLHAAVAAGQVPATALELRPGLAWREPWRLLSAHLVHINTTHVLINAAGWVLLARLFAPELAARTQALVLLAAALAVGAGLVLLHPAIAWYRGFSGVLHALFFAGAVQWLLAALRGARTLRRLWLPALLVAGGTVKVLVEQPAGSATPYAQWLGAQTVPQAHLFGALAGVVVGLARSAWAGDAAAARSREQSAREA